MTEKKDPSDISPKRFAKRIEELRAEVNEVRNALAPSGTHAHESLYAILKEADRALQNDSVPAYLDELRDDD